MLLGKEVKKMSKKTILLGAMALVLGGLVITPTSALAYQGNPSVTGPNCTSETHDAIQQAIENGDYNTWKELMNGRGRITEAITEDNFAKFAEAYKLAQEGKTDEANTIRQELGLGLGNRFGSTNTGNQGQNRGGWNR